MSQVLAAGRLNSVGGGASAGDECVQKEVINFLADPSSHACADRVERFETHGNLVFLAGAEAWKIKRAVRLPYMDFSTLAKRRAACAREVEINRRFGSDLYLGCVPIARAPSGKLIFGAAGEIVEWAVHMRRFEQSALLSTIARKTGIPYDLARLLADVVYEAHERAEPYISTYRRGADATARQRDCGVAREIGALRRGGGLSPKPHGASAR